MAMCASCQIDVPNGKFCTTCGRQLVDNSVPTAEQITAAPSIGNTNLAMWSHLAPLLAAIASVVLSWTGVGLMVGFLLWLPGLLIRQNAKATAFDRRHATESMNFQLSLLIYSMVLLAIGFLLFFATSGLALVVLLPVVIAYGITALVFNLLAVSAASGGREYRYPAIIRFVK